MRIARLALAAALLPVPLFSQAPMEKKPAAASTSLTVTGPAGKSVALSVTDFKALSHTTIEVFNEHTQKKESYSGVPLVILLKQVDTPTGAAIRGKLYLLGVVAEGTDHYKVLYSISEVDPENHMGNVIVADQQDGKPIAEDGAFKLISSEEKRPARWVRNLTAISVKAID